MNVSHGEWSEFSHIKWTRGLLGTEESRTFPGTKGKREERMEDGAPAWLHVARPARNLYSTIVFTSPNTMPTYEQRKYNIIVFYLDLNRPGFMGSKFWVIYLHEVKPPTLLYYTCMYGYWLLGGLDAQCTKDTFFLSSDFWMSVRSRGHSFQAILIKLGTSIPWFLT